MRRRGLALVPILLVLAALLAPSAWADTYTAELTAKFDAQTLVVADPAARPPLQNSDALNQQILNTSWTWSAVPPVWVAAVAPSQTGITTPDAIHSVILGRMSDYTGVILVIDSKGYHVRAYNVPKAVADNVDRFMSQSAKDHHNDPYGATSEFVRKLADLKVGSGERVSSSPVVNKKHSDFSWLWSLLIIIGIGLAAVGLVAFVRGRNRKRRRDAEARDQVKQEMIDAESGVNDLDSAVLANSEVDVSAEALKANSSLHEARKAYQAGDYSAARAHLRVVQSTVVRGNQKLNPSAYPPAEDRKQASVQTRNPETGQPVTINNNNYSTTPQAGYQNYYGGGYHNGMFFYPGYYPYAFWGPGWGWALTDVLLVDALLDDHWGGGYGGYGSGYDQGFEAGRDSTWADSNSGGYDSGQSSNYDSQQGDVGFDGSNDSYSGGGDVGFSGGGGGYDSGGGGFDFGGGFDSGGSDFGGGFDSGGGGDSGF